MARGAATAETLTGATRGVIPAWRSTANWPLRLPREANLRSRAPASRREPPLSKAAVNWPLALRSLMPLRLALPLT